MSFAHKFTLTYTHYLLLLVQKSRSAVKFHSYNSSALFVGEVHRNVDGHNEISCIAE